MYTWADQIHDRPRIRVGAVNWLRRFMLVSASLVCPYSSCTSEILTKSSETKLSILLDQVLAIGSISSFITSSTCQCQRDRRNTVNSDMEGDRNGMKCTSSMIHLTVQDCQASHPRLSPTSTSLMIAIRHPAWKFDIRRDASRASASDQSSQNQCCL
jgi:hypothetical protein